MTTEGKDPTLWELMRGLDRVELSVRELGGRVVSVELYAADQNRVNNRLLDLETGIREAKLAETAADNRADEQKTRIRWILIGLISSPFVGAVAFFIIQGGLK